MGQLYCEQIWNEWLYEELKNYELTQIAGRQLKKYNQKGYLHFDPRFWFPDRQDEIKAVVSNPAEFNCWNFYPFLQVTAQTQRFKPNSSKGQPKRSTKKRPICYAAHKDSLIYGFYSYCLTKLYEAFIHKQGFADSVSSYRTDLKGNCNIQFAKEVFDYIKQVGECNAIALDIKGFFDSLDHIILKINWAQIIGEERLPAEQYKLYTTLTEFAFTDREKLLAYLGVDLEKISPFPQSILDLFPTKQHAGLFRQLREKEVIKIQREIGIPQGSPMSAVLSNIYMVGYDARMSWLAKENGFLYKRYCDDILIVCSNELAREVKLIAYEAIEECKLTIQPAKEEEILFRRDSTGKLRALNAKSVERRIHSYSDNRMHYFYKPLQYLGFEYNGQDVLIRNSSICRFHRKLKRRVTKSVKMAYSRNGVGDKIFKQTTYRRYSHLGKRNFLTYAYRAAAETYNSEGGIKLGMNSKKIRGQVARHMKLLEATLNHKNNKRYQEKMQQGKAIKIKTS